MTKRRALSKPGPLADDLREIAVQVGTTHIPSPTHTRTHAHMRIRHSTKVGVGMPSIQRQFETWPTRTLFYRRHMVQTQLLASDKKHRRLAWLEFLSGQWDAECDGNVERITLECDFELLTVTWKVVGCTPRNLDWSWGGFSNTFTLAGGDDTHIVRWRPSVRQTKFDDDHVVWLPYSTKHVMLIDKGIIVYTRVKRTLTFFKDADPVSWACVGNVI